MEPTDKDRLDWLGEHRVTVLYDRTQHNDCCLVDPTQRRGHTGKLREAIDSAMAAERSGAPGAFGEGVGQ